MIEFRPLRWLSVLFLSLLWITMGQAAVLAERVDFDHCAVAAKGGVPALREAYISEKFMD